MSYKVGTIDQLKQWLSEGQQVIDKNSAAGYNVSNGTGFITGLDGAFYVVKDGTATKVSIITLSVVALSAFAVFKLLKNGKLWKH